MSTEENKAIVRRVYDAINSRTPDALDDLIAADVRTNQRFAHDQGGLAGFKQSFSAVLSSFPDYEITIDDQIAEGEQVITRYTARGTQDGEFMGSPPPTTGSNWSASTSIVSKAERSSNTGARPTSKTSWSSSAWPFPGRAR